jgi:hypothetical protein
MSSPLAIAAVSAVLKNLLDNALVDNSLSSGLNAPVTVRLVAPNRIKTDNGEASQLNLYLYQVTPNSGWRNVGLPSRNVDGERLTNPPLALDLHYLLTAYGKNDFEAEILLGYAMQMLHETPCLTRDAIRTTLGSPSPLPGNLLPPALGAPAAADLADQIEQIKIVPQFLSTEEMSKLWTAMQTGYHISVAYQVSVVLIESRRSTKSSLPVRAGKVYVLPFDQPFIEEVKSDVPAGADPRITLASTLAILGQNLKGPITRVALSGLELPPPAFTTSDTRISFPLASLTGLRAGVQTVQVIQQVPMGEPEVAHRGFESNAGAFLLHPTVTVAISNIASTTGNGITTFAATVTVNFVPNVGRTQRVTLVLNEFNPPANRTARAYSFPAPVNNGISLVPPIPDDTASIAFAISSVLGGDYLVRIQVDGAENVLGSDNAGNYNAPRITIA